MKRLILVAALLSGCYAEYWVSTHAGGIRRMAEYKLRKCLTDVGQNQDLREECLRDSVAYCLSEHIERGCGLGGP